MADYIPHSTDEFSLWLDNFAAQIALHGAALDTTPTEITRAQNDAPRYAAELAAVITANNAYRASLAQRNHDRADEIEPWMRALVQRIQNHPAMTDAIRHDLGITVPDLTPTPLGAHVIEEVGAPLLVVDIAQPKRAALKFGKNPLNQRRNALPAGMRGVRLWYFQGDGPPAHESDWKFLDDDSRSPYTHVTMNDEAMTLTYRAAYVDRQNRVGAFSEPVTVTINP